MNAKNATSDVRNREGEDGGAELETEKGGKPERSSILFDPWLQADSKLPRMTAENMALSYLQRMSPRKRVMKLADQENLKAILTAILTNLAYAVSLGHDPATVGVSLGAASRKITRYDRRGFAMLPRILETLAPHAGGTFSFRKSTRRGVASQLTAGPLFTAIVRNIGLLPSRFSRELGRELILLSRTTTDFAQGQKDYEWIDYPDTIEAIHFRNEVGRINAMLSDTQIGLEGGGDPTIETSKLELRRFFKLLPKDPDTPPRFDQGGRLFGGWWQDFPKDRRSEIRIDGEAIADLDFASMFLRLAYLEAGHVPPEGDLYAMIPGFSDPRWRAAIKVVVSAMLFRDAPMKRLPKLDGIKEILPLGTRGPEVRRAVLAGHPLLADVFETGIGFRLMFLESQILIHAMLGLIDDGIPSLPMHDGLQVPASKQNAAHNRMVEAAIHVASFPLPVVAKAVE